MTVGWAGVICRQLELAELKAHVPAAAPVLEDVKVIVGTRRSSSCSTARRALRAGWLRAGLRPILENKRRIRWNKAMKQLPVNGVGGVVPPAVRRPPGSRTRAGDLSVALSLSRARAKPGSPGLAVVRGGIATHMPRQDVGQQ